MHFSPNEVLLFKSISAIVKVSNYSILFVSISDTLCHLVNNRAYKYAIKGVACMVTLYFATIWESNTLEA